MKNRDYPLRASRVAVIGLDSAPADLVLKCWPGRLKNIETLISSGFGGVLTSTIPPITIPAWTAMLSGQDPGQLGLYGFRNRMDYSYEKLTMATSRAVRVPRVWDFLSRAGLPSIVIGVPQTYPPTRLHGLMVSCFLTPGKASPYTFPLWLKAGVDQWAGGEYLFDVPDFRTEEKDRLYENIRRMTRARFKLANRLLKEEWVFFMMVEMGTDRIQHGFWRFQDSTHRLYQPGNPYRRVILDYYLELDSLIGELVDGLPSDTLILVVSDHGARSMIGGVAINEWLRRQGLLKLKVEDFQGELTADLVDWSKTSVWGEGGYYARLFFNVAGREPQGIIPASHLSGFRTDLIKAIEGMTDHRGERLGNQAFSPQELYRAVNGYPPDLLVFLGDLSWRSVGRVGLESIYTFENDRGPDDANHDLKGLFIVSHPGRPLPEPPGGRRLGIPADICQIAPTILAALGIVPSPTMVAPLNPY